MKKLYMISGTMGVGKTTTCRQLRDMLPDCAFLDGDWCWDMHPFKVTEESMAMVTDNICHILNNFLKCSIFENVIFCWVMHRQEIIDEIIGCLEGEFELRSISLVCTPDSLKQRLSEDVRRGVRQPDVIERSIEIQKTGEYLQRREAESFRFRRQLHHRRQGDFSESGQKRRVHEYQPARDGYLRQEKAD